MVRYSHLFQNFPQFIVIHTVKGFCIVNKAEIDFFFLELSCFFNDTADVGYLGHFQILAIMNKRGFLVAQSKESACNAGDRVSIPGSGGSPGEGNGNPLQYSCLEKSMDRGAGQATVHGITELGTTV